MLIGRSQYEATIDVAVVEDIEPGAPVCAVLPSRSGDADRSPSAMRCVRPAPDDAEGAASGADASTAPEGAGVDVELVWETATHPSDCPDDTVEFTLGVGNRSDWHRPVALTRLPG